MTVTTKNQRSFTALDEVSQSIRDELDDHFNVVNSICNEINELRKEVRRCEDAI